MRASLSKLSLQWNGGLIEVLRPSLPDTLFVKKKFGIWKTQTQTYLVNFFFGLITFFSMKL